MKNEHFDVFMVGGGSFAQYFRDETIPESGDYIQLIRDSVLTNFKEYLFSNEPRSF